MKSLLQLLQMDRDEVSLLLFLETCAVDQGGKVDVRRMNRDELKLADHWRDLGLINWGRIEHKKIIQYNGKRLTYWVYLSDEAWRLAAEARRARGLRNFDAEKNGFITVPMTKGAND